MTVTSGALAPRQQIFPETLGVAPGRGRLQERRILVVGAGQRDICSDDAVPIGNGRAIALLAAREGAAVVCLDISEKAAVKTCEMIAAEHGHAYPLVADIANPEEASNALFRAASCMGGIDGLVLNVGITRGLGLSELTYQAWDAEFAINLRAHMLLAQAAIERMDEGSSIVVMSAVAALRAKGQNPAYESSKAAQIALSRSVAMAGQARGIRCNALVPGLIDTPMGHAESVRRGASRTASLPFARQGTGWEVAYGCIYLLSNESSYVNAHALVLDGGLTAGLAG